MLGRCLRDLWSFLHPSDLLLCSLLLWLSPLQQHQSFQALESIMDVQDRVVFISGGWHARRYHTLKQSGSLTFFYRNDRPRPRVYHPALRDRSCAQERLLHRPQQRESGQSRGHDRITHPAVQLHFLECNQTSLAAAESAVQRFLAAEPCLDLLVCNAGIMGKDAALTRDGYELHFGVNHMAHALMAKMLLPALARSADPRMLFLVSNGFRFTPPGGIVFDDLKTPQEIAFAGRWRRYGQSKLANVIYAAGLTKHHPDILAVSIHPGVIKEGSTLWDTELSLLNRVFTSVATAGQGVSVQEGVRTTMWAATVARDQLEPGAYY